MKRVKQIVMMAFASLLAQCVWAAITVDGSNFTVTNWETTYGTNAANRNGYSYGPNQMSFVIPAAEGMPVGGIVKLTTLKIAEPNNGMSEANTTKYIKLNGKMSGAVNGTGNLQTTEYWGRAGYGEKQTFTFDGGVYLIVGKSYVIQFCKDADGTVLASQRVGVVSGNSNNVADSVIKIPDTSWSIISEAQGTVECTDAMAFTYEPTSTSLSSPSGWITSFSGEPFTGKRLLQANDKLIPVVIDGSEHPWNGLAARTSSFTIALYADVSDVGNTKSLFELGDKNGMHAFVTDNNGKVTAFTSNGSGTFEAVEKPKGIHIYTLVYDKEAQTSTFYVDGVAKGSKTGVSLPNTGFQIGNVYANGSYGKADGLAVAGAFGYDKALSATEVAALAGCYPVVTRGTNADGITYNTANGEVRLHDAEVKYIYGENNAVAFTQTGDVTVTKTCADLDGGDRPYPVFLGFNGGTSTYNLKSGTLDTANGGVRLSWNGTGKMYVGDGVGDAGSAVLKAKGVFANSQSAIFQVNSDGIAEIGTFGLKFANNSSNRQIILNGGTVKATAATTIQTVQNSVFKVESDSTIDANGFAVTESFGSAVTGNGTLTLTDSSEAKNGSHTINSLSGIAGLTLGDVTVTISNLGTFAGTMTIANADKVTVSNPSANAGTINLNGGTLTFAAGNEGTVNVAAGATIKLVASEAQIATGYTATNVTAAEGATITFVDAEGNVLTSDGKSLPPSALTWTGNGSDNNFTTPENWTGNVAPTATTAVSIASEATINMTGAQYKMLAIDANVTFTGTISHATMHDIIMTDTASMTIDVASGEQKIRHITGGKIIKTGDGILSVANNTSNQLALDGTTVEIRGGLFLPNNDSGADADMLNPTFIIGENGSMRSYGWTTVRGTLTLESDYNKSVFMLNSDTGFGGKIKGGPAIVKNGTGVITLRAGSDANFGAITVNGGRLDFGGDQATTVGGVISGSGAIGVNGAGLVTLNGNSDGFSGGTIVTSGELKLGHKYAIGGQGKAITVNAGGSFDANGKGDFGADLTLNGGTFKNSVALGNSSVQLKGLTLEADSTFDLATTGGVLNNSWNATTVDFKGHKLTKTGAGDLTLAVVTIKNPGMIDMQSGNLNLVVYGGATTGKLKFDLTDVVFGTAKKTLIQYPAETTASIDNIELVNVGETGYTLAAEDNLVVLKRPATTITMKEWGFTNFVLGDQTAELIEGDTILLSSELPDNSGRWDATNCSKANGHAVIVEQEMNWKANIGTMTLNGVQVYTYRTQGAKIVSGATVSGTGTLKINDDYIDVEGPATISCSIHSESAPFKLADGATLTVATALAEGKVISGVDTKKVATKTVEGKTVYGLVDKNPEPIVPEEGTGTFPEGTVITKPDGTTAEGPTLPEVTGTYTVQAMVNGFPVGDPESFGVIVTTDETAAKKRPVVVAVPFAGATVGNIVKTTNLTEGDELMALEGANYRYWTLTSAKKWVPKTTVLAEGLDEGAEADAVSLARGTAIWVVTANKVVTQGKSATTPTPELPTTATTTYLLANPTMGAYTVPVAQAAKDDQVVLPGSSTRYTVIETAGGVKAWKCTKSVPVVIPGLGVSGSEEQVSDEVPSIGVGKGFWFLKK